MNNQKETIKFKDQVKSVLFSLKVVFKNARLYSFTTLIFSVFSGLAPIAQAYFAGAIFGQLAQISSGTASKQKLILYVVLSATVNAVNYAISNFSNTLFTRLREGLSAQLNGDLLEKYTQLRLEMLEMPDVKEQFEKANAGMREVIWAVNNVANLASAAISITGALVLTIKTSPWLAFVFLPLPFVTVSLRIKSQKLRRDSWKATRVERMRMHGIERMFSETTGVIELRLYGLVRKFVSLWHKNQKTIMDKTFNDDIKSTKFNLGIELAESVIGVCVDVWLVMRVFAGVLSVGIFEQTRRLVSTYVSSLSMVSNSLGSIAAETLALNDYRIFVKSELDASIFRPKEGLRKLDHVPKEMTLSAVEFSYPKTGTRTIRIPSLRLNINEHIALVGENGAGKTTLLKLLLGLYEPTAGAVLLDGTDTRELDDEALAKYVAPLMQDFSQFDFMTVRESVTVGGSGKVNETELKKALQVVGLYDYFIKKPKKLDSTLGWAYDDSLRLSGGQWQRLAIARALYKNAHILILDEPTSAIDAKSEQDIIDAIFEKYEGRMVIVVSHRISTVKRAKRILVLKKGEIVEDGTHKELFKEGTAYFDLFGKQALAMREEES